MRIHHDPDVTARVLSDPRALQMLGDAFVARASIAANAYRAWDLGRRWFVIVAAEPEP